MSLLTRSPGVAAPRVRWLLRALNVERYWLTYHLRGLVTLSLLLASVLFILARFSITFYQMWMVIDWNRYLCCIWWPLEYCFIM